VTDDGEAVLLNDIEVIDGDNDPEKVTVVKRELKSNQTSVGDKVVGKGKEILQSNPKTKEHGQRSWFEF